MITLDFMELEIKQATSDFCKIRDALSVSLALTIVTVGSRITSVIEYFPSICSNLPFDLQLKLENSNFKFLAIAKNVVIKQLLTDAVNKCSSNHIPRIPFENSGGVATSIQFWVSIFNSSEYIIPLCF